MPNPILSAFGIAPPKASPTPSQLVLTPVATRRERQWRDYLGNQGTISKAKPTVSDKVESKLADNLGALFGGQYGRHVAKRATAALNDATPLGNATGIQDGQRMFAGGVNRGDLLAGGLGLGIIALNAIPFAGGMKRKAGATLSDLLTDEAGAFGPKRFYHGTTDTSFNPNAMDMGKSRGGNYGPGLYVSARPDIASSYAGNHGAVFPVELDRARTLDLTTPEGRALYQSLTNEQIGEQFDVIRAPGESVVINPKAVRSAIR